MAGDCNDSRLTYYDHFLAVLGSTLNHDNYPIDTYQDYFRIQAMAKFFTSIVSNVKASLTDC